MVRWLCFASCSAFDFRLSLPLYARPRGKCIFNILRVYIVTSMDLRAFAFAFAFEPRLRNRLLPLPLLLETIERSALAFALSFSAGHVGAGRAGGGALQDGIGRDAVVGAGLPGERRVRWGSGHRHRKLQRFQHLRKGGRYAPLSVFGRRF